MEMSLVLRLPREMHLCRSSSNVPRLPSFLKMLQNPRVFLNFTQEQNPLRLPHEMALEHQTVVRTWCACGMFTSTRASRHNGVHFLYISAAKTAPDLKHFVHVDLEICFAPERRALFEHLNSQKRSDTEVLLAFSLRTCIFCTSQLPKLLRS